VDVTVGAPQVAYRETITRKIEHEYTHERHVGPTIQFAKVKIRFEPLPPGGGYEFENAATLPEEYVSGVAEGLALAKDTGVLAGFPMTDFKAMLIHGEVHDVDSGAMAFDIAARACLREAIPKAGPKLLEPMMKVEVTTPEDYIGDVIGDMMSRRGQVQRMESRADVRVISAMAPLSNMFGYGNALRSMTRDRGRFTLRFDHYEQVPYRPDGGRR
jgi:elongation factor G